MLCNSNIWCDLLVIEYHIGTHNLPIIIELFKRLRVVNIDFYDFQTCVAFNILKL